MTRILNKLNSLQEISDTQAAAAILGLTVSLCSENSKVYNAYSYINFVLNEKKKMFEENMIDKSSTFSSVYNSDTDGNYLNTKDDESIRAP